LRLSKAGYGTPEQVLAMRSDIVLMALDYEKFVSDYESEFIVMNREQK
jgi:hypothetical protein